MNYLSSLAEKTILTYVQSFIALLVVNATNSTYNYSTATAAAVAAIPAALTVVANGLPVVAEGLPFYTDLVARTIRTYVAAFLGLLVAVPTFTLDVSSFQAAAIAAIPAALAVIKALVAKRIGDPTTASLV